MDNLLSIGEVSKIKGVSIKALRYYGELGILNPAYINEESGYRYYKLEQLIIIDLIITCVDSQIPLKHFNRYIDNDYSINMDLIQKDAQEITDKKIEKLQKNMELINKVNNHYKNKKKEIKKTMNEGSFIKHCKQRYFLISKYQEDNYDLKTYRKEMAKLYKQCIDCNMHDEFNDGIIYLYQNNIKKIAFFIEVTCDEKSLLVDNIIVIPENDFRCELIKINDFKSAIDNNINKYDYKENNMIIAVEFYDLKINTQNLFVEFQHLISSD